MFVPNRYVAATAFIVVMGACARTPSTENSGAQASGTPPATPTPAAGAATELRGTTWLLTTLGDKAITATDTARAAQMILRPDSKQVNGSGGCNRLFGVYELNGDALRFSGIGSTKMACQDGMDTETARFCRPCCAWRSTASMRGSSS